MTPTPTRLAALVLLGLALTSFIPPLPASAASAATAATAASAASAATAATAAVAEVAAATLHPFASPDEPARYPATRRYHLQHVRLDLAFDLDRRTVSGTATNTVVPLLSGVRSLVFHAAELSIAHVRLAGAAGGSQELPFATDPQAQTLTVRLDRAYGPDDRLEVAIDYSAQPRAGLYFVGPDAGYPNKPREIFSQGEAELNRYWFPSWDEPDDRATSELLATVAPPLEVIGNGRLVEVLERADGRRTFHWLMEQPHSTYLVSVAVGEFSRLVDHWHGVPIESYVPAALADLAPAAFGRTADMMDYFSTVTGRPYPFAKYAQVVVYDYMYGGQENITATTLTTTVLRDRRAMADDPGDEVVSHELAHQWFGDLITCRTWDHAWLNEGMASYFEALYRGHVGGEDELALQLDGFRHTYFAEDRGSYRRPIVTRRYPDPDALFDATLYQKGALVLHMAHEIMGDEGWWKGIREYVARNAGKTVATQDLESALEDASGVSLGALFDQYVYGAGYPEIKVRWEYQAATGMVRLSVRQTQKLDEQTGLFSFPVDVALVGEHGATVQRVPLRAQAVQEISLPSAEQPRTVVFDPRGAVLALVDFDKPDREWIAQLQGDLPLAAKLQALRALGTGGSQEGVAALARALEQEPFYGTRAAAAEALAEAGGTAALAALERATSDGDPRSRAAVFTALGKFPAHPEVVPRLTRALGADDSFRVRAAAAEALGRFDEQRQLVTAPLLAALGQQSFRQRVQRAALNSLARLDVPQGYTQALQLAHYGNDADSRRNALHALASYAVKGHDAKRKDEARRAIESYLADPDYLTRSVAANALADLADPASITALARSARNEAEPRQRHAREDAIRDIEEQQAQRRQSGELAERVRQLEREQEVLGEQVRELREAPARGTAAPAKAGAAAGAAASNAAPGAGDDGAVKASPPPSP